MVPDLLFILLSSGALASVFVPVFTEYLEAGDRKRAWYFYCNAVTIILIVITTFVVLGEIFIHPLTSLVNKGWVDQGQWDKLAETARLTRIVLPAQIAFFVGAILIAVQYAHKRFMRPALGSMLYNAFIIVFGLALASGNPLTRALHYPHGLGPAGFSWGALVGAFAGNIFIQVGGVRKLGGRYRPVLDWRDPGVHTFMRLMIPVVVTLSLPQLDMQVNKWFATFLKDGSVASLDYANRLMQLPLGILAQAAAIAIFPFIAGQAARHEMEGLKRSINMSVRAITAMTVPASVLMIVLAEPIVRIIYQHGHFTASDTQWTSSVLVCYCVGIAAWSATTVLSRGFYALQDTWTPMSTGTVITGIFILMNLAVVHRFQDRGLAGSTTVAAGLFALALFYRLHKRLGGLNGMLIVTSLLKVTLASAFMGIPVYALRRGLTHWLTPNKPDTTTLMTTPPTIFIVLACTIVGAAIYCLMLWVLKVDEARFVWDKLAGRFRRK
jgi:putative peptidoglycan lipid II flippase